MSSSGYDFYLGNCLLPVPPEKLTIKINNGNSQVILINDGEINLLKAAKLTDVEFECLLPQVEYPFATYKGGFLSADYFLDYFEELKTSEESFQFIVSRVLPSGTSLFSTNMTVTLEEYKIVEDASDGFDVRVKIELKQYRTYGSKTVTLSSDGTTATVTQTRA